MEPQAHKCYQTIFITFDTPKSSYQETFQSIKHNLT